MKKVGIILPVYNSENTIAKTIDSVLKQTYEKFELIIVNDNSSDKTEDICKNYCKKYKNVFLYNNIRKGVSSARNFALSKTDADYIMFIDSDDTYEECIVDTMMKNIGDNDLVICSYRRILNNNSKKVDKMYNENMQINDNIEKKDFIEKLQRRNLFNQVWNKIYNLEKIKKYNILFDENINIGEDLRFNLQYIEKTNKIKYITNILYNYYVQENGLSYKYSDTKLKSKLLNIDLQSQLYQKEMYNMEYIYNLYMLTIFSGLSEIVKNNDKISSKKIIDTVMKEPEITKTIEKVYRGTKNIKNKIFALLLKKSGNSMIKCYASIGVTAKKIYRRRKLNK